ncbi:MAG: DUF3575 domain-containing protein [bacterium]
MSVCQRLGIALILSFFSLHIAAQVENDFPDSVDYKKNVIRWNLTPFLLWSNKNINLGYERVLKPYRSFSVNAGYFELPRFAKSLFDSLQIKNTSKRAGLTVSGDYRMYFKKRNRKTAPDGLYWGVYGSYHFTKFENDISVIESQTISGDLLFGARLNLLSAGVELGYQFIIKERLSIDLVFMGPSITFYATELSLGGKIETDKEDEYLQAIYDVLKGTIPGFDELVNDGKVTTSGANLSLGLGLRYLIQIGYRF